MKTRACLVICMLSGLCILFAVSIPAVADVTISKILITGAAAPGKSGRFGVYIKGTECINGSGQIAFRAMVPGDRISAWIGTAGHLRLVPDSTGNVVHELWIDDSGTVFFMPKKYTIARCSGGRSAPIYESYDDPWPGKVKQHKKRRPAKKKKRRHKAKRHKKGRPRHTKVARSKRQKRKAVMPDNIRIKPSGDVFFICNKRTPILAQLGHSEPLVRGGIVVPALNNSNLTFERFSDIRISSTGHYFFGGWIAGPGISHLTRCDYFLGHGTTVRRIELPDTLTDHFRRTAVFFNSVAVNAVGTVAFLMGRDLWMHSSAGWKVISGSDAPRGGPNTDESYEGFKTLVLHDDGTIAFGSGHSGFGSSKLWIGTPDAPTLVATAGMHAPGTPDGVVFAGFPRFASNRNGQMVFEGRLTGDGLDYNRDTSGIWSFSGGKTEMVIRQGDKFEIAAGDTRSIRHVFFDSGSNANDGRRTFNDRGQLVFGLDFDRVPGVADVATGLFIATIKE